MKHIRDAQEKLLKLGNKIEKTSNKDYIVEKVIQIIPQIFLHSGMAVKLIDEQNFELAIDQMHDMTRDLISGININAQISRMMSDEKYWCDFSRNESLTVEKIIRSAFLNESRHSYPEKWPDKRIYSEADSADWFISKV